MKKIISILIVFAISVSCERTIKIDIPPVIGDASSAVLKTTLIPSGDKYIVEADIHVVDDRGQFIRILNKNNFIFNDTTIRNNTFSFRLLEVKSGSTERKGDYSAMLLLDQSGSILTTDPYNSRIDAAKTFLENLGTRDDAGLASFTTYVRDWFTIHNDFTRDISPLNNTLDQLSRTVGGGTPLYYSTYNLIDYVEKNARNQNNKALIVFTDGGDTEGYNTPAQIIDKANNQGVQIFTVGLGSGLSNLDVLSEVAQNTGGYFMWAQDAKQLISYFGTLGNLLNGNAGYYRIRWEISSSQVPGRDPYVFYLTVKLSANKSVRVAIPVKFT